MTLRDQIILFVTEHDYASFAQLDRRFPTIRGDTSMAAANDPNVIFWHGLSEEAVKMFNDLSNAGLIRLCATIPLVYFVDGKVPDLPVAQRRPPAGYKAPHWLPVVLRPGPALNVVRVQSEAEQGGRELSTC